MALPSEPRFRVHHALRIKGFAKIDHLVDLAGIDEHPLTIHLDAMKCDGLAQFREARELWQLTPAGREAHQPALETDAARPGFREGLGLRYPSFLELNEEFKALCGDWQLRDGAPNDHADATYDAAVIARLGVLDRRAQEVAHAFGTVAERFACYAPRLARSRSAVEAGQPTMFTGVMCGSYHDVWMELHEDLLLTQRIDRMAEGSF